MKKIKIALSLISICSLLLLAACGGTASNASSNDKENEKGVSDYPKKPVTLMIPYSAGGSTDLFTRQFASIAEEHLGQKIIIKNETGGGGLSMYSTLAKAKPDGYTMALGLGTNLYAVNPHLNLMEFSGDDFSLVSPVLGYQYVIAAGKDAPFRTFEEMIEYSKNNKVTVAVSALPNHIYGELINQAENFDLKWEFVNFKGAGEATAAVLGGHVDLTIDPPITLFGPAESGEIKLLAQFNEERSASMPDVPTLVEMGYDLEMTSRVGIGGPKGLPEDVIAKWEEVIAKTIADSELKEFTDKNAFALLKMTPEESEEYFNNLSEQFGSVIDRVTE